MIQSWLNLLLNFVFEIFRLLGYCYILNLFCNILFLDNLVSQFLLDWFNLNNSRVQCLFKLFLTNFFFIIFDQSLFQKFSQEFLHFCILFRLSSAHSALAGVKIETSIKTFIKFFQSWINILRLVLKNDYGARSFKVVTCMLSILGWQLRQTLAKLLTSLLIEFILISSQSVLSTLFDLLLLDCIKVAIVFDLSLCWVIIIIKYIIE